MYITYYKLISLAKISICIVFVKRKRKMCTYEIPKRENEFLGVTLVILGMKKKIYASRAALSKRLQAG
jgi:hypothetical protein